VFVSKKTIGLGTKYVKPNISTDPTCFCQLYKCEVVVVEFICCIANTFYLIVIFWFANSSFGFCENVILKKVHSTIT